MIGQVPPRRDVTGLGAVIACGFRGAVASSLPASANASERHLERGMVCLSRHGGQHFRFVLRPNCSLTWGRAKLVVLALGVAPLTVAMALAWRGLWPVLPFAGAELLALWCAFYVCARRGGTVEVVTVDEDAVAVEKGRLYPHEMWNIPRAWVEVSLRPSRHFGHPSRLVLSSHGVQIGLGEFLTEEERHSFAMELRRAICRH